MEKEIQLRLFFEQKVNALHKHNSDWVSKHDLILQKF